MPKEQTKQAPRIMGNPKGKLEKGDFSICANVIKYAIYKKVDGKHGTERAILLEIASNQNGFGLSTQIMMDRCAISTPQGYYHARQRLIDAKLLIYNPATNTIRIDYKELLDDEDYKKIFGFEKAYDNKF